MALSKLVQHKDIWKRNMLACFFLLLFVHLEIFCWDVKNLQTSNKRTEWVAKGRINAMSDAILSLLGSMWVVPLSPVSSSFFFVQGKYARFCSYFLLRHFCRSFLGVFSCFCHILVSKERILIQVCFKARSCRA